MDAIRYLDADTILDYLHNSSETYLEGLIPQSYGFPTETDRSVYVRLLKVPVRDKASEVYMQAIVQCICVNRKSNRLLGLSRTRSSVTAY